MGYGLFEKLEPGDGYSVERVVVGPEERPHSVSLHLQCRGGGERLHPVAADDPGTVEIDEAVEPDQAAVGRLARLQLLAEAVARFLNAGGDLAEVENLLESVEEIVVGRLVFPGFTLIDDYAAGDGDFAHVFAADDGDEAVVWSEGRFGYVDLTTLEEMDAQRRADEAGAGGDAGGLDPLLDSEDPPRPQLPGRGAAD